MTKVEFTKDGYTQLLKSMLSIQINLNENNKRDGAEYIDVERSEERIDQVVEIVYEALHEMIPNPYETEERLDSVNNVLHFAYFSNAMEVAANYTELI